MYLQNQPRNFKFCGKIERSVYIQTTSFLHLPDGQPVASVPNAYILRFFSSSRFCFKTFSPYSLQHKCSHLPRVSITETLLNRKRYHSCLHEQNKHSVLLVFCHWVKQQIFDKRQLRVNHLNPVSSLQKSWVPPQLKMSQGDIYCTAVI